MPFLLPLPSLEAFWHDSLYDMHAGGSAATGLGAATMARWEARSGFRIPDELRALYAMRDGGVSDWLDAVVAAQGAVALNANFGNRWSRLGGEGPLRGVTLGEVSDGIDFGEEDDDYRHVFGEDADRMWVVANYGSSQYLMLDYRNGSTPAITLFDDDARFRGDGSIQGNGLSVLAPTFDAFLQKCRRAIHHPLRVWSVDTADAAALMEQLRERLSAVPQPVARLAMEENWHRQYGQNHLRLPDPYLAEAFQPDFGTIVQLSDGALGDAVLRVYRNASTQGTRAERFASEDAVLVSLLLPVTTAARLPESASDAIEAVLTECGLSWRRWLDTDGATFVAEDDLLSPHLDHPAGGGLSSSSPMADA